MRELRVDQRVLLMYRPFPPLADFLEQEHRRAVWNIRRQAGGIGAPDELDSFEPLHWRNHARQAAQQPPSDLQRWSH